MIQDFIRHIKNDYVILRQAWNDMDTISHFIVFFFVFYMFMWTSELLRLGN